MMNKRSSALLQSISEAQEAEKVKSSQEAQQADGDEMNQTPSPIPASPSRAKKQRKKTVRAKEEWEQQQPNVPRGK